jgi:Protein of unknown function (DUF1566)
MQNYMSTQRAVLMVILGLWVLTGGYSSAEAVITIRSAEVVNGVAVVQGGNAARSASIYWEGVLVTQANNGGNFAFQGVIPADCIGSLHEGDPAAAIAVALANCGPVSDIPAPVPQTGQTQCWDAAGTLIPCEGTGQDGDLQAGVPLPSPRFTDNGNGTVRDNLTGLIWLQQANCFGQQTWAQALAVANALANGSCGLTDGSVPGDWRLPNFNELQSLATFGAPSSPPFLPTGEPFLGVQAAGYWSSTTYAANPSLAFGLGLTSGGKDFTYHVWPVRGGE